MRDFLFLLAIIFFLTEAAIFAQPVSSATYGFSVEPPVEWNPQVLEEGKALFFDSGDGLTLEVKIEPMIPEKNKDLLFKEFFLAKSGYPLLEQEPFFYDKYPAILGIGSSADQTEHLFLLWIEGEKFQYWLTGAIKGKQPDQISLALIYSALDSFSLGTQGRYTPGPITQFDVPFNQNDAPKKVKLHIEKTTIDLTVDVEQVDAAQRLVEREALIMSRYKVQNEMAYLAWIRYYRFIYRDNYTRLANLAQKLDEGILAGKTDSEVAQILLKFSQNYYQYVRFTTPSDLIAPYSVILTQKGDCDAVGLLYIILLNYQKIDTALLLSQQLGHAIVGVKVDQEGTALDLFDSRYVSAEMTTKDPLGTVPARVAKTTDWFPILFLSSAQR